MKATKLNGFIWKLRPRWLRALQACIQQNHWDNEPFTLKEWISAFKDFYKRKNL